MPSTAETASETAFLKSRSRLSRGPLFLAAGCSAVNAALLVLQYRLLAGALAEVVFAGATLAQAWPRLWPVPLIAVIRALAVWISEAAAAAAAARVKQVVRTELLERLMGLGPVLLSRERTGDLSALLVDGVEALEPYYARFLPAMATAALMPLVVLGAVLPWDRLSALVLALTAPLIPLFMILIGKSAERLNQRQWARLARLSAHFLEVVQGLTVLKLFNASRREAEVIAGVSDDYRLATMSVLRVAFLSALALEFFATLGIAVVAVQVGFRLLWGDMIFERGLFVLLLAPEFYLPLRSLGSHYHARMEAIGAAGRMAELLAVQPGKPHAAAGPAEIACPPASAPDLCFDDVRLTYADGRQGLDGADFKLAAGTTTALVGASGAGKSSVVNILLRFAAPTGGLVLVDGRPLGELDPEAWRRRVAWVPQRPHLFRGAVADNIRLGAPEADTEAVETAARLAGADGFIRRLPGGYAYRIGEGGKGLSGGQRRLIALARAALRQASVLILDEPTASLDRAEEQHASAAVRRLAEGRTVLIIAHRLETIRSAGSILLLDGGRVAERGSHQALMEAGGLYARLVRSGSVPSAAEAPG